MEKIQIMIIIILLVTIIVQSVSGELSESGQKITCWYKNAGVCLPNTYWVDVFEREGFKDCSEVTYMSRTMYNSQSQCQKTIGKCTTSEECSPYESICYEERCVKEEPTKKSITGEVIENEREIKENGLNINLLIVVLSATSLLIILIIFLTVIVVKRR